MANFELPVPNIGVNKEKNIDELINIMVKYKKELEYIMMNLDDLNINSLSANKISAGTIDASVIDVINLDADNIVAGSIDASDITVFNLNANNIVTGSIDADDIRVYNLNASEIETGTLRAIDIDGVNIYGSKYYSDSGDVYIDISDQAGYGDFTIRDDSGRYIYKIYDALQGSEFFVYDDVTDLTVAQSTDESRADVYRFMYPHLDFFTNDKITEVYGEWDFTGATTSGLTAVFG